MSRTELTVKSPTYTSMDFSIGGLQTDCHRNGSIGCHSRILSNHSPAQLKLTPKRHRVKFVRREKSPSGFMQIAPQDRGLGAVPIGRSVVTTLLFTQNQLQSSGIEKSPGNTKTVKSLPKVKSPYEPNRPQVTIYKLSPLCAKRNSYISGDREPSASPTHSVNLNPKDISEIPSFRGRLSRYLSKANAEIRPRPHFLTPDLGRKQNWRSPSGVTAFKRHSRALPISKKRRIQMLDLEKRLSDDEDQTILGPW